MIAAVVSLSIALSITAAGLFTLAVKALGAERRCGDARTDEAGLAKSLEAVSKERDDAEQRATEERKRADALDDLLAEMAAAGPVDGAYDRVLSKWQAVRARRDGPREVPAPSGPTATSGDDELLRPGD